MGRDLPVDQLAAPRNRLHVWGTDAVSNTTSPEKITRMKIATHDSNDNNHPLDSPEQETLRQHEASHGDGPAPDLVRFLEETIRFPITVVAGRYVLDNGRWLHHRP